MKSPPPMPKKNNTLKISHQKNCGGNIPYHININDKAEYIPFLIIVVGCLH